MEYLIAGTWSVPVGSRTMSSTDMTFGKLSTQLAMNITPGQRSKKGEGTLAVPQCQHILPSCSAIKVIVEKRSDHEHVLLWRVLDGVQNDRKALMILVRSDSRNARCK